MCFHLQYKGQLNVYSYKIFDLWNMFDLYIFINLQRDYPFVGQAMHYISSTHSNRHEDRTFNHACRSVGGLSGRKYTTYWLNYWDQRVDFRCAPGKNILLKLGSHYSLMMSEQRAM